MIGKRRIHESCIANLTCSAMSHQGEMGSPTMQESYATTVNISLTILTMSVLNMNMEIDTALLLHQRWYDTRLSSDERTRRKAVAGRIWRPMITLTEGEVRELDNEINQFWRGFGQHGNILLSQKIRARIRCSTEYKTFPFDRQYCFLKLGTYRFPVDEVKLIWDLTPVDLLMDTDLKHFYLTNYKTYSEFETRPSGNFSILIAKFDIKRNSLPYITAIFVPTFLMVLLAYITLWLSADLTSVRILLCGISIFGVIYVHKESDCAMKSIYVFGALNVWFLGCIITILLIFIHNLIVDTLQRKAVLELTVTEYEKGSPSIWGRSCFANWLDRISRLLYPIMTTCLSIFYYTQYNNSS